MKRIVQILAAARELWPLYLGIVVVALLTSATALLTPFLIAQATELVVGMVGGELLQVNTLLWLAAGLLLVMAANTLLSNIGGYWGDLMAVRLRVILSQRYYEKLLKLPQSYYDDEVTGTVISRLNRSITSVTDFLKTFSNGFFSVLITLAAVLVVTAWHSPWLTVLLLVIYPVFFWLTARSSTEWQKWEKLNNENYDIANGRFAEVVGQMRVVKSFVAERRELAQFNSRYDQNVSNTRNQSAYWHKMDVWRRLVVDVIFGIIYAIIFVQTARGEFSVGSMVLLIQLVNLAKDPIMSLSWLVDTTQRALTGSQEYFKVMAVPDEPNNPLSAEGTAPVTWDLSDPIISYRDMTFGYDENQPVLHDINLAINRGERVALVSESGGGKTTLVNLLMKLYEPTSGQVIVGGHSTSDVPTEALRSQIGVVFQDANLFSGTVRENIAYGTPDATDEQLREAARRANALGFIDELPKGLDTEIGERGIKLSGGQKQRISVARAILKDAPVLVLDEATSALDTKAERQVQAGLDELMEGRTSVIIAHRLSTIATVDRIVTLKNGRIDEVGTPAELARSGGIYSELLALQQDASEVGKKRLLQYDITA